MSIGRFEIDRNPGGYISGNRARKLLQEGRARITREGKLCLFQPVQAAVGAGEPEAERRMPWTAYSGVWPRMGHRERWPQGFRMNGSVVNRAIERP